MRGLSNDADKFGYKRLTDPSLLTSSLRTNHTELSRQRFAATPQGSVEPVSRFFKLPPDGVSNTLRAGTDSQRGAFTSPRPIHYKYARCITVREMARLHGFPDWFRFHVTKWHGARQIGNAGRCNVAGIGTGPGPEALIVRHRHGDKGEAQLVGEPSQKIYVPARPLAVCRLLREWRKGGEQANGQAAGQKRLRLCGMDSPGRNQCDP
ncbi:MAG: hypothetical protein B7X99_14165 [Rhizobiales bacterium 17-65-6]|nr:MAG: hypothetical protein B7X99_14165 [Rhizobiales bacterium 17-65-6]